MALEIPKLKRTIQVEHSGQYREVEIEDRPYRLLENQFIEHKGCYEDVKEFLSDWEILEAGGIDRFFNDDGSRRKGSWPFDPDKAPSAKKAKKKAKRKTKKKAAKKK